MALPTHAQIAAMPAGKSFRVPSACPACGVRGRMDIIVASPGRNFSLNYFCGNCQATGAATPRRKPETQAAPVG